MELDVILKAARLIAEDAGALIRSGRADGYAVATKSAAMDVVTEVDQAVEALVVGRIREEFPDDGIVGEEGASVDGTSGRRWIIDPIDGTANFVHGWQQSVVSIGVEVDGEFAVGVVYNPFNGELFTAATGHGAYLNDTPIRISDGTVAWSEAFVGVDGAYGAKVRAERSALLAALVVEAGDVRVTGAAALSLCYLACGRFDAHYIVGSSIWDIAAGVVILREAGFVTEGITPGSEPEGARCLAARPELLDSLRDAAVVAVEVAEAD